MPKAYQFELSNEIDLGRDLPLELIEEKASQYNTDLDLVKKTMNTRITSLTIAKADKGQDDLLATTQDDIKEQVEKYLGNVNNIQIPLTSPLFTASQRESVMTEQPSISQTPQQVIQSSNSESSDEEVECVPFRKLSE